MKRLIDADALRNECIELIRCIDAETVKEDYYDGMEGGVENVMKCIDDVPTVDAEPVRHGKWIIRDNPGTGWYRITCSECGEDVTSNAPCIGFLPNAKVLWNYCPECGARMDEE